MPTTAANCSFSWSKICSWNICFKSHCGVIRWHFELSLENSVGVDSHRLAFHKWVIVKEFFHQVEYEAGSCGGLGCHPLLGRSYIKNLLQVGRTGGWAVNP
ncbi:hypothetical protein PoB_002971900 [Plakobranchus ocellatus]|uniref:Uncharacterized protein n=1 Tax=Plakobranchus ocellatus TaxID=259542 RepID=A0AAV4A682_9GAST|nr:hypothetical protein PoB_002971900 [Plakobranchus ocellatus]